MFVMCPLSSHCECYNMRGMSRQGNEAIFMESLYACFYSTIILLLMWNFYFLDVHHCAHICVVCLEKCNLPKVLNFLWYYCT